MTSRFRVVSALFFSAMAVQRRRHVGHDTARRPTTAFAFLVTTIVMPVAAAAQGNPMSALSGSSPATYSGGGAGALIAPQTEWAMTIGAAGIVRPTFVGSDRYTVTPVPFFHVSYDDMLSLDFSGLSAYWHHDALRIGGELTYNRGRKDSQSSSIFNDGDSRLNGLGNVKAALGLKAFVSYKWGPVDFGGSATKFVGHGNDGIVADIGASLPYRVTRRLSITPHVGVSWANQSYLQTFFGVTSAQAVNSGFPQFTPHAGFDNVAGGISFTFLLTRHLFIGENVDASALIGDAAKSPTSFSKSDMSFATLMGYHF